MKKIYFVNQAHGGGGLVAKCQNNADAIVNEPLQEVRGAVVAPSVNFPGYCLIMGVKREINEYGKNPLLLLHEIQKPEPGRLIQTLIDDAYRLKLRTLYAVREAAGGMGVEGFFRDLWNALISKKSNISLEPAASVNDVAYGMALIREWTNSKAIDRPPLFLVETVIGSLLENLSDITMEIEGDEFYPFHALRYLLAGLVRSPVITPALFNRPGPSMPRRIAGT